MSKFKRLSDHMSVADKEIDDIKGSLLVGENKEKYKELTMYLTRIQARLDGTMRILKVLLDKEAEIDKSSSEQAG